MINLCAPAIVYLVFSISQILIDILEKKPNDVIAKTIVATLVTLLLNALCERDLTFVSWMFVFIPLSFMVIMNVVLLYIAKLEHDINVINNPNTLDRDIKVEYLPRIPYGSSSPAYQS